MTFCNNFKSTNYFTIGTVITVHCTVKKYVHKSHIKLLKSKVTTNTINN